MFGVFGGEGNGQLGDDPTYQSRKADDPPRTMMYVALSLSLSLSRSLSVCLCLPLPNPTPTPIRSANSLAEPLRSLRLHSVGVLSRLHSGECPVVQSLHCLYLCMCVCMYVCMYVCT